MTCPSLAQTISAWVDPASSTENRGHCLSELSPHFDDSRVAGVRRFSRRRCRFNHALISAPMKDKSSDVNSNETWRLSPAAANFPNRLSRFKGGVTLAKRSSSKLNDFLAGAGAAVLHRHIHASASLRKPRPEQRADRCKRNSCSSTRSKFEIARVQHFPFCRIFPSNTCGRSEETIRPAGYVIGSLPLGFTSPNRHGKACRPHCWGCTITIACAGSAMRQ